MNAPFFCNLARLDLVSIRLVVLCVDEGSLSAAARRANLSKSNASHRLASLEATVGAPVFVRTPKGVQMTEVGELLVSHGRSMLELIDQLNENLLNIGQQAKHSLGAKGSFVGRSQHG